MTLIKAHYLVQHTVAFLVAPVLRLTGYRFSKAWRGNPLVAHVEANLRADGYPVKRLKF